MPNDLRDGNFTPYKSSSASKSAKSAPANGCLGSLLTGLGIMLLVVGFGVMVTNGSNAGSWFTLIGVFVLIKGVTLVKAAGKRAKKSQEAYRELIHQRKQNLSHQTREQAQQAKACPNPEPHRHYETPPKKQEYDTFVDRNKKWPTDQERRLQNMKNLYDAGLLTREEYDDEVRKLRS